ncbi:MAG: hypothetical protein XD86_0402, partial [Mesotoga infera]
MTPRVIIFAKKSAGRLINNGQQEDPQTYYQKACRIPQMSGEFGD